MGNTFKLIILSFFLVSCSKTECIEKNCAEGVPMSYIAVCGYNNVIYPNWKTAEYHGIMRHKKGECCNN
tara:strand:+ start:352 stop:558 length:207 start_codon:yes stop_codon:yes gene_type:complete